MLDTCASGSTFCNRTRRLLRVTSRFTPSSYWAVRVVLLTLLTGGWPAVAGSQTRWSWAYTDGLEVVSAVSDGRSRMVVRDLLQFREAAARVMPELSRLPRSDLRVFIVDGFAHRQALMGTEQARTSTFVGMHLSRFAIDSIIVDLDSNNQSLAIVQHEMTHHLVAHLDRRPPSWLNEGLAESFAGAELDGRRVNFGRLRGGAALYVAYETTLPLDLLWKVHPRTLPSDQKNAFYGTAHTLVHAGIFGTDDDFRQRFHNLLQDPDLYNMSEEVVQRHFGRSNRELESYLREYLDHGRYRFIRFDRSQLGEIPVLTFTPLEGAERAALLAGVAASFDRSLARTYLVDAPAGSTSGRLATARIMVAMGDDEPIDPAWLAAVDASRQDPQAPSYLHLISASVRLAQQKRLLAAEVNQVVEAVGAYRQRRGLTRDARRLYAAALAKSEAPPQEAGLAGLLILARRFGTDPVMMTYIRRAFERADASERLADLQSPSPDNVSVDD